MARCKFTLSITACVLLLVPVVVPALFVLRISPAADQVGAQELGPKQAYLSGPRPAEAPLSSANQAATNQAAKPTGKMSFIPASPTPRDNAPKNPRAVANPVVRREVPQPPKYAVSAGASPNASPTQSRDTRSIAARPARPQPSAVASKTPLRAPVAQQSDRPQSVETLEPVVAANGKPPTRTLEEPNLEEPLPEKGPGRGVVQLFFEDESADEDSEEMMDMDESPSPTSQRDEIRHVASQNQPAEGASQVTNANLPEKSAADGKPSMKEIMADLTPVSQIKLGLAVKLPELGKNDSEKVREPNDQALAMMQHRKPFSVFGISRDPWQANRDSYPFYHKPLWFEDPNLERCGRGCGPFTSTVSAIRASANIPILPYRFTAEKPWSCVRTLPDCSVCEKFGVRAYLPPWSLSAAVVQAAASVGVVYIVP